MPGYDGTGPLGKGPGTGGGFGNCETVLMPCNRGRGYRNRGRFGRRGRDFMVQETSVEADLRQEVAELKQMVEMLQQKLNDKES